MLSQAANKQTQHLIYRSQHDGTWPMYFLQAWQQSAVVDAFILSSSDKLLPCKMPRTAHQLSPYALLASVLLRVLELSLMWHCTKLVAWDSWSRLHPVQCIVLLNAQAPIVVWYECLCQGQSVVAAAAWQHFLQPCLHQLRCRDKLWIPAREHHLALNHRCDPQMYRVQPPAVLALRKLHFIDRSRSH